MMKILSRTLAIILAMMCALNLATVSLAAAGESSEESKPPIFDKETGLLYLESTADWETLLGGDDYEIINGMEMPAWYVENHQDVRKVYIGENCLTENDYMILELLWRLPNIEEVIVDEDNPCYNVYDKGVYSEDYSYMLYYPIHNDDVNIVLHEDTKYIYWMNFIDTYELFLYFTGYYPATDKEYNLYITRQGQLQKMVDYAVGWDLNAESLYYSRYANIYANETQETLDNIRVSEEAGYPFTIEALYDSAIVSIFHLLFSEIGYLEYEANPDKYEDFQRITEDSLRDLFGFEDPTFEEYYEIYETMWNRQVESFMNYDFGEYTKEDFERLANIEYTSQQYYLEMYGSVDKAYAMHKHVVDEYMKHAEYLYNRGNPLKPLSTLTSGTCGEGTEWTIDRENGILRITGEGTIDANYTGFDVFKDEVKIIELGRGITVIGENVFYGFDALENTIYKGTRAEWDAIDLSFGNEDLVRKVTIDPDKESEEIVTPEEKPADPDQEEAEEEETKTPLDSILEFFEEILNWLRKLFGIVG